MTSTGSEEAAEVDTAVPDAAAKKRQPILGTLADSLDLIELYRSPAPATTPTSAEEVVAKALTGDTAAVISCKQATVHEIELGLATPKDTYGENHAFVTQAACDLRLLWRSLRRSRRKSPCLPRLVPRATTRRHLPL